MKPRIKVKGTQQGEKAYPGKGPMSVNTEFANGMDFPNVSPIGQGQRAMEGVDILSRCPNRHVRELGEKLNLSQLKLQTQAKDDDLVTKTDDTSKQTPSSKRRIPEIVVYEDPRKRKKAVKPEVEAVVSEVKAGWKRKETGTVFNVRKAQYEVQKLVISGLKNADKEEAKMLLAIQLGAKPPKNKNHNYKEFMAIKKRERDEKEALFRLDNSKLNMKSIKGKKSRKESRDKNDVHKFDSQLGKYRDGVQVISKHDLFKIKKSVKRRRKAR